MSLIVHETAGIHCGGVVSILGAGVPPPQATHGMP